MQSILIGNRSFRYSLHTIVQGLKYRLDIIICIDLPSLQSIQLGRFAMEGSWSEDSCSIQMMSKARLFLLNLDLPMLTFIHSEGNSFRMCRRIILKSSCILIVEEVDIPNLDTVDLPFFSFSKVIERDVSSSISSICSIFRYFLCSCESHWRLVSYLC